MVDEREILERARPTVKPPTRDAQATARRRLENAIAQQVAASTGTQDPRPPRHRRASRAPALPRVANGVLVFASVAIVALVIGAFALLGTSSEPQRPSPAPTQPASTTRHLTQLQTQARALYAPIGRFYRSLSNDQDTQLLQGNFGGDRINACQAPYSKQLFGAHGVQTSDPKLYNLYSNATLMEQYQTKVALVAPELRAVVRTWENIELHNPSMRNLARGLASEFNASLNSPRLDACAFLHQIAQHDFSLAWAQQSPSGQQVQQYIQTLTNGEIRTGPFWNYIRGPHGHRLLTHRQQINLANMPGEFS